MINKTIDDQLMDIRKRFSALLKLVKFMRLALLYLPIKSESFSFVLFKTCFKVRSLFSVFFPPTIKSSTMTSHFSMSSNISVMAISKTSGADQTRPTGNLSNLNPPKGVSERSKPNTFFGQLDLVNY